MGVDIIALLHILEDIIKVGWHTLSLQFVVASLGAHNGRCRDKYFQFGIGEHRRANVATVHHDALVLTHRLLLLYHRLAHEGQCSHLAHPRRHLHRAYLCLHHLAVETCVGATSRGIQRKTNLDTSLIHGLLKTGDIHLAIAIEEPRPKGEKSDTTIHSTCVNIDISQLASQVLGHCTLAARRESVDGYCNLIFHNFLYCICNVNNQ